MQKKTSSTYSEKLKDPRWQKKRLQILERDNWICQKCCDSESQLHVHHKHYSKDKEPWEYEDCFLITLCLNCHEEEKEELYNVKQSLLLAISKNFISSQILDIAIGFYNMEPCHAEDLVASAIGWAISDERMQRQIIEEYLKYIKNKGKKKKDASD